MPSTMFRAVAAMAFAFVFLATRWADAAVMMFPTEVTNVEQGEGEAIAAVIADAYASASGQQVSIVKPDPDTEASVGDYPARTKALGGSEYLVVQAVRLDEKIRIRATRHKADGTVIASESMTAISLDDLEPVADRLATALAKETTSEETRNHRNVTGRETQAPNRLFNEKVVGVKAQADIPLAKGVTITPPVTVGINFKLEADAWFVEFGGGFMIPTPTEEGEAAMGGLVGELGASYYLTDHEVSLYAGGGALPRILISEGAESGANLALYGQFGAMFARSSSTRVYADLRVAQSVTPVALAVQTVEEDPNVYLSQAEYDRYRAFPTELIMEFGIGW